MEIKLVQISRHDHRFFMFWEGKLQGFLFFNKNRDLSHSSRHFNELKTDVVDGGGHGPIVAGFKLVNAVDALSQYKEIFLCEETPGLNEVAITEKLHIRKHPSDNDFALGYARFAEVLSGAIDTTSKNFVEEIKVNIVFR